MTASAKAEYLFLCIVCYVRDLSIKGISHSYSFLGRQNAKIVSAPCSRYVDAVELTSVPTKDYSRVHLLPFICIAETCWENGG